MTPNGNRRPMMLVTVGSDHHTFDRLITWVDRWLDDGGAARVDCVIQYGTAERPRNGQAWPYLDHGELQGLMEQATVIVMQGGPIGIKESRRCGRLPVVVPRLSSLGEVVDDHQVTFARAMAAEGLVAVAESETELRNTIEAVLQAPSTFRVAVDDDSGVALAINKFAQLVAGMAPWNDAVGGRRTRWWSRRGSG